MPKPQIGHFPNANSHINELTTPNKKKIKTTFQEFNLEHFYELREHIISALSSYWPGKNYPNMEITKAYKGNLEIYIARGRKQASFNTNQYKQWGHIALRLVQQDSSLAKLLVWMAHKAVNHNKMATKFSLLSMHVGFPSISQQLKTIHGDCIVCQKTLIAGSTKTQLIKDSVSGASTDLMHLTLAPKEHHISIDFFGPIVCKKEHSRSQEKIWVLIFYSNTTKCVYHRIMASTSTLHVQLALDNFSQNFGAIRSIWSDQQSSFISACNSFTISENMLPYITDEKGRKLTNPIENLIKLTPKQNDHQINWRVIPANTHFMGGQFENLVKLIKQQMKKLDFFRHNGSIIKEELDSLVGHSCLILNNRPLFCYENTIITPNHLKCVNLLQFDSQKECQVNIKDKEEKEKIQRIRKLKEKLTEALFFNSINHLCHTTKFNQRARAGKSCQDLRVDDLVVDYQKFRSTKSISKSLARIYALSENKRSAILYYTTKNNEIPYKSFKHKWEKASTKKQRRDLVIQYLGSFVYYSIATDNLYFLTRTKEANFKFENHQRQENNDQESKCLDLQEIQRIFNTNTINKDTKITPLQNEFKQILQNTNMIKEILQQWKTNDKDKENDINKGIYKVENNENNTNKDNDQDKDKDNYNNKDNENDTAKDKDTVKDNDNDKNKDKANNKDDENDNNKENVNNKNKDKNTTTSKDKKLTKKVTFKLKEKEKKDNDNNHKGKEQEQIPQGKSVLRRSDRIRQKSERIHPE